MRQVVAAINTRDVLLVAAGYPEETFSTTGLAGHLPRNSPAETVSYRNARLLDGPTATRGRQRVNE